MHVRGGGHRFGAKCYGHGGPGFLCGSAKDLVASAQEHQGSLGRNSNCRNRPKELKKERSGSEGWDRGFPRVTDSPQGG